MTAATIATNHHGETPLSQVSFPRTGKRGVPQQFPRRLYEMLDSENKSLAADANHPKVIAWSDSGLAFRIFDVAQFSDTILPKYFRTKKFSSFQRNLNLYGFAKVRRGADTDMYAHPSFVKDHPESLVQLRKTTPAQRRGLLSDASSQKHQQPNPRSVSPHHLTPPSVSANHYYYHPHHNNKVLIPCVNPHPVHPSEVSPVTPQRSAVNTTTTTTLPTNDRGKLDLLTFALEREFANRRL